jgi:hypothetical protein
MHTPNKNLYPDVEKFSHTNHEYFRYHNAYLKSYNENELVRIFAEAAVAYDPKTMGNFSVDIRCSSGILAKYVASTANVPLIIDKAKASISKKNKKAAKLLDGYKGYYPGDYTGVVKFLFDQERK